MRAPGQVLGAPSVFRFVKKKNLAHFRDKKDLFGTKSTLNLFRVGPGLDLDYKVDRAKAEQVINKLME